MLVNQSTQAPMTPPAAQAQSSTATNDEPIPYTLNAAFVDALADRTTQPGHFAWCGPKACVTSSFSSGEIITEHFSAPVRLAVPEGEDIGIDYVLSSQIYIDDQYPTAYVWIAPGGDESDELSLDGPQTDAFCDAMQAFIDGVRAQRRLLDAKQADK